MEDISKEERRQKGEDNLLLQSGVVLKVLAHGVEDEEVDKPKESADMCEL